MLEGASEGATDFASEGDRDFASADARDSASDFGGRLAGQAAREARVVHHLTMRHRRERKLQTGAGARLHDILGLACTQGTLHRDGVLQRSKWHLLHPP